MIDEVMGRDPRWRVIVTRSGWILWKGADPLECAHEQCGSAYDVVQEM